MGKIEFHDRGQGTKEIMDILDAEPSLVTSIYGPIKSGKTALVTHLIDQLPEGYVVFYINLMTKFLASYGDFIESLFEMDEISKRYLVKENILFVDPLTKMIKPQSQLDLLAIRDVVA